MDEGDPKTQVEKAMKKGTAKDAEDIVNNII